MPDAAVDVAHVEDADYDAVVRSLRGNDQYFTPIQLKEYVPNVVNERVTLDGIFNKLASLGDSSDLVVAIYLNRRFRWQVECPPLNLGGLYFFGAAVPDKSEWFLIGDLLKEDHSISTFAYPR